MPAARVLFFPVVLPAVLPLVLPIEPGRWAGKKKPLPRKLAQRHQEGNWFKKKKKRWAVLHLHIHHIGVGLHQAVAHLQRGLKADLGFLHGDHGLFQADGWVFHLHLAL